MGFDSGRLRSTRRIPAISLLQILGWLDAAALAFAQISLLRCVGATAAGLDVSWR